MSKKAKVLLLRLPQNVHDVYDHAGILHPYSLAIISSFLKREHKDVTLFDAAIQHVQKEAILSYIEKMQPDMLGLTLMTQHLPHTIEFLRLVKEILPALTVVVGGPHATADHKNLLLQNKEVDVTVIGEGEYSMLALINAYEHNESFQQIKGIAYREDDGVHINPRQPYIENLDALPFADWESLPMDKYADAITVRKNYGGIVASRGCPYSCTFCGAKTALGQKVRRRSPQNIVEEIQLLYDRYGVRQVLFHDSTLNIDNAWVNEICEGILRMNKPIVWGCNVRTEHLSKETLMLMKRSGCIRIFVGIESGDNTVLQRMKKGTTVERIQQGLKLIEEVGIPTDYGFILGMPGETVESMKKSIALAKKLKGISTFALASPFPGTELYEIAKSEGVSVKDWSKHDIYTLAYVPQGLTRKQLEQYYRCAVRTTYFRFSFIIYQLSQLRSLLNVKIVVTAAYRIFFKRFFKFRK
ncbi:MAG: B12-binding domain-containing radical SAM protein [Candidatus Omnitrophica bacterium]|nr:B12-binding domain-containing radical SAM protein [Candidatus Omnitrophota bacterium]